MEETKGNSFLAKFHILGAIWNSIGPLISILLIVWFIGIHVLLGYIWFTGNETVELQEEKIEQYEAEKDSLGILIEVERDSTKAAIKKYQKVAKELKKTKLDLSYQRGLTKDLKSKLNKVRELKEEPPKTLNNTEKDLWLIEKFGLRKK